MSFTPAQQPAFRVIVKAAWAATCKVEGWAPSDKEGYRAWYEEELSRATGHRSTSDCNPREDYEEAIAHFEMLAGESIYWQMRRYSGKARRILHEAKQLAADFDCDDAYMLGIARQSLRREVENWDTLQAEDLLVILRALKIQVRRQLNRGDRTDGPRKVEELY